MSESLSRGGRSGGGSAPAAAPASASLSAPAAPGGALSLLQPSAMDEDASEALPPREDAAARAARKTAAAETAAAAACVQLAAAAKGPYSQMHSSDQVLLLDQSELWDTIAENWCKPGDERISSIVDTWEGRDLAACVHKLGLPVIYAKKNYQQHMRRSVVDAVRAYAHAHPELFEALEGSSEGSEQELEPPAPAFSAASRRAVPAPLVPVSPPAPQTPPRVGSAAPSAQRRSPRAPASSRSVAAAAMAALQQLPAVGSAAAAPRAAPAVGGRSARRMVEAPPAVHLLDAGAGESDGAEDSEDDSDWVPDADPLSASLRYGGRLRDEEVEHQLARAGVQRPFANGFIANAKFAAGGRSIFQLYKEVTASFTGESSRRECLALSRILDALLRGDVSAALEHTCRRLGGVHTAAETGNWAMCERLESEAEQRSFVPDAFMRSALRSVTQLQAVKKSAADGAAAKGAWSKGASASGRERRSSSKPYSKKDSHKDRDTTKDSGAGASQKKKGGSDPK
jgi:hypothetical protein